MTDEVKIGLTEYEYRVEVLSKLTRLETLMMELAGNGKAGRVDKLESSVRELETYRARQSGIAAGISGVVSALSFVLYYIIHALAK